MALVECKECGSAVSTNAVACPKCGTPTVAGRLAAFFGAIGKIGFGSFLVICIIGIFLWKTIFLDKPAISERPESAASSVNGRQYAAKTPKEEALAALEIKKLNWHKGGFDNVMLVDVTIQNSGKRDVKDVELKCTHFSKSGTRIDSNTKVIYEVIAAGKSRSMKDFSMGFIHSQASRTNCEISDVVVF